MGPLKSMGPGVIVPPAPPLSGPGRLQLSFASAYKNPMQCAKSQEFLIQTAYQGTVSKPLQKKSTVPTYHTRTITKKAYHTS